jgi:hypothetical protein
MRMETYYNLHKQCLSARPIGGKVEHYWYVALKDVSFAVQPAGRAKVLRERKKNVHAFVRGDKVLGMLTTQPFDPVPSVKEMRESLAYREVTYNPYKYETFVYKDTEQPVHKAEVAWVVGRNIFVKIGDDDDE